jgi:hypothetical protein
MSIIPVVGLLIFWLIFSLFNIALTENQGFHFKNL